MHQVRAQTRIRFSKLHFSRFTAQFWLGKCYLNGHGVGRNEPEGISLFRAAAMQGYASGQAEFVFNFARGSLEINENDRDSIAKFLERPQVQMMLAELCRENLAVLQPACFYKMAADNGVQGAWDALKQFSLNKVIACCVCD